MGYDYFTLNTLAAELHDALAAQRIMEARSGADGLELTCESGQRLTVCIGKGREGLFLSTGQCTRLSAGQHDSPLRYLLRARIIAVEAQARDRIIHLRLERVTRSGRASYGVLLVELLSPWIVAVLLREADAVTLGYWGQRGPSGPRLDPGTPYVAPHGSKRLLPNIDPYSEFSAAVRQHSGKLERAAARSLAMMDRPCMREILHRAGLCAGVDTDQADEGVLTELWSICRQVYAHPVRGGCYLWQEGGRWCLSGLQPTRVRGRVRQYESVSKAMTQIALQENVEGSVLTRRRKVASRLRTVAGRLQRRERALVADLMETERADELQRMGNTLMARLHEVPDHSTEVCLRDVHDIEGNQLLRIALEPDTRPADTAARLLRAAGKLRRRRAVLPAVLENCRARLQQAQTLLQELELDDSSGYARAEQWLGIRDDMDIYLSGGTQGRTAKADYRGRPRRYRTSTGWSVWAGRNNRENDALTHKLAAQNDLWFHAHGYAGAHVILRREERKDEPDGRTLEETASLAAYWSKGRNSSKVPVVYTLAKYVSRPRGAAPGKAVIRREKTLMVKPGLLVEEDSAA